MNCEWYVCRDTWKQKVIFQESLNLTRNRHFFPWNWTFGTSLQGVLHPFKAPKGSKALFRWGYFQAWNARQFLKGNIWKCDEHLWESMQTLRYHGSCVQSNALLCSHDTWGIESSRAAVKGTKPKLQDRRGHLPHCSSRKFTCNGSPQEKMRGQSVPSFSLGHLKEQFPSLLQYAQNLANTVYESIKRVVRWAVYYCTHGKSYYPVVSQATSLDALPRMTHLKQRESLMIENEGWCWNGQQTMVKLSGNEQCARKLQSSQPELCL